MGIRVAQLQSENVWVVYHSTTGSLYEPMFYDELSAWLFAHVAGQFPATAPMSSEKGWGDDVQRFVKLAYGGEDNFDDGEVYIDELTDVGVGTTRGREIVDELYTALLAWVKSVRTLAVEPRALKPEPE